MIHLLLTFFILISFYTGLWIGKQKVNHSEYVHDCPNAWELERLKEPK